LFEQKASVRLELAGTGENELRKHVSREAGLKELKSVPEIDFASRRRKNSAQFASKLNPFWRVSANELASNAANVTGHVDHDVIYCFGALASGLPIFGRLDRDPLAAEFGHECIGVCRISKAKAD
jgi:hypothetical protein